MVALALEIAIKVAMGNHLYSFNGSVRLQLEGGPIGNRLSGALAKVYMLWWCRALIKALTAAMINITYFSLYLLFFYVDDTNLAMEELEPGCRLVDGKVVVVKEEVEGDKSIPGDRRTALVIQEIANSVCKTIRMTIDCIQPRVWLDAAARPPGPGGRGQHPGLQVWGRPQGGGGVWAA